MKAVILAGGRGRRLEPYTTVIPKPLMPVGDKPILEIVLRQLRHHGITDVIIAVGYLSELIAAFFGDGSRFGLNISYSREETPLGTAGCLGLIKPLLDETFLMMNGDILTTLSYSDLLDAHRRGGAMATVALNRKRYSIDFGIVETDSDQNIVRYNEKPTVEHMVSMGIYAFEPEVLQYVEPHTYLDFPHLIERLIREGEPVRAHIADCYWLDIGREEDYRRANAEIDRIYPTLGMAGG
ncbi:MAG: sugar phosphate nucleotidyltransferase [Methanomicrobiales archaeon]|nr:sugar phosphate nucleotidyltransferase [Methanomicrobiales archaeon]MDI6876492.1 sugar phosphate nucleotidyltransferase [Methanomicrobiales archaeon]